MVYVLMRGATICGVYSSKEKAQYEIDLDTRGPSGYSIEEWEVE